MTAYQISLRIPDVSDFSFMLEVETDEQNQKYTNLEKPSPDEVMAFLISGQDYLLNGQLRLMIILESQVVGMIDLFNASEDRKQAETGIFIRRQDRRNGIANAAYNMLFELCMRLGIVELEAEVSVLNTPANKLYKALGFNKTTELAGFNKYHKVID
ncbi:MAG: GNAT family N-acetyltransferase [Bacteroidetes bacterium]|nr:GNAT family N-acetyltransferase [Bacteroidota bacterium]